MKCKKVFITVFAISLAYVDCGLPLRTRPWILPRKGEPRFPRDFRLKDLPYLRVPSSRFCTEQELQPAEHYVVLPWWYNYCQELRERNEKKQNYRLPNLYLYKDVLRRVDAARKKLRPQ